MAGLRLFEEAVRIRARGHSVHRDCPVGAPVQIQERLRVGGLRAAHVDFVAIYSDTSEDPPDTREFIAHLSYGSPQPFDTRQLCLDRQQHS
jgi:hypothetical protein